MSTAVQLAFPFEAVHLEAIRVRDEIRASLSHKRALLSTGRATEQQWRYIANLCDKLGHPLPYARREDCPRSEAGELIGALSAIDKFSR